jgi:hypothetical protein
MKLRISRLLAIAAFAGSCLLCGAGWNSNATAATTIDVTHANLIPLDTGSELLITFNVQAYAINAPALGLPPNPTFFYLEIIGAPPVSPQQYALQATLQSHNNMVTITNEFSLQNGMFGANGGPLVPTIQGITSFSFSVADSINLFGSDAMGQATIFLRSLGAAVTLQVPDFYQPSPCINQCVEIAGVSVAPGGGVGVGGQVDTLTLIQGAPVFAGTPGKANCHGQSVSALARQYGGLNAAAAALG